MSTLSILAMIGFGAMQLAAQSGQMYLNVPFDFSVGTQSFAPGKYFVSPITPDVVAISSADRRAHGIVMTHRVQSEGGSGKAALVFHRYGNSYFLWQIWSGDSVGKELPPSTAERKILATIRLATPVPVVASRSDRGGPSAAAAYPRCISTVLVTVRIHIQVDSPCFVN